MRILILSQYYWPEPIPKPMELAQALSAAGDEVTVLTGFPNYPTGRLYGGYKLALIRKYEVDRICVLRTYEFPYHGTRAIGRFANYVSFMLSAPFGSLLAPKLDAIYVWHPPLTIGIAAWLIALLRGIPFVYDVQDIWPEAAVLSGILKPGFVVRCLSVLERFIYRRANHLLAVTEGARSNLISKGVAAEKVTVMPHWFDDSIFVSQSPSLRDATRARYGWDGQFVLLFAGNLGLVQGLETLVYAAENLRADSQVLFAFVGEGADKPRLQGLVESLGLGTKVQFIERQPMGNMPSLLSAADGLLVHLKHSELSNYVIPTKTLAYLGSGTPIIMAMSGAAASLIEHAGAGIVVPPEDPIQLAMAVRKLLVLPAAEKEEMGRRGRAYLRANLSKDVIVPRYRAILEEIVRKR